VKGGSFSERISNSPENTISANFHENWTFSFWKKIGSPAEQSCVLASVQIAKELILFLPNAIYKTLKKLPKK